MVRSNRTRGALYVRDFETMLAALGYDVDKARPSIAWIPDGKGGRKPISRHEDFFNAFDIIGIRHDSKVLLVQVTTISEKGDTTGTATIRRKHIESILPVLPLKHVLPIVAGRRQGKNWIIWVYATAEITHETKWWKFTILENGKGANERRFESLNRHLACCDAFDR